MNYSYELNDPDAAIRDVADVRLYATDNQGAAAAIFSDEEIKVFLRDNAGVTRLAAASALDFIAARANLVLKKGKTEGLELDGPAVSKELRAQAATLRAQHAAELEAIEEANAAFFEIVPATSGFWSGSAGGFL